MNDNKEIIISIPKFDGLDLIRELYLQDDRIDRGYIVENIERGVLQDIRDIKKA